MLDMSLLSSMSRSREFSSTAENNFTGIFISPKLIEPVQIGRILFYIFNDNYCCVTHILHRHSPVSEYGESTGFDCGEPISLK